jgi:hypothetical protein
MRQMIVMLVLAIMVGSCKQSSQNKAEANAETKTEEMVAATINELLETPAEFQDKEVVLSGMVTHVCRHGGQKCFLVADDGETQIRLVPAGKIDEFKVEIEGSMIAVKGIFRVLNVEQSEEHLEDHESKEHHEVEMSHSEAEKADYFVETTEFKEVGE